MSKPLVPDDLWEIIQPLLPAVDTENVVGRPKGGDMYYWGRWPARNRVRDRCRT